MNHGDMERSMQDRLNTALSALSSGSIREYTALARRKQGCILLTLGEPDCATSPEICDRVTEALQNGETHYIENAGSAYLRRAVSDYERERHGLFYAPDEIVMTAGATGALFAALCGILNPGDEVIVPIPAFVLYEQIIRLCRGVFVPLDTSETEFRIDAAALEGRITPRTKAIILNSPNNPTGCVYGEDSLEAVRRAVSDRAIFVISDEVYRELCDTAAYRSIAEFTDLRDRVLVAQSFSKTFAMTGWRLGYLMCDASVRQSLVLIHQYSTVSVPAPFERAAAYALTVDPSPFRQRCAERQAYVLSRLCDMGLPAVSPQGGFYVFADISEFDMTSAEFCTRMIAEAGVAAVPGLCFGSDRHIRISVCASDTDLREGTERMAQFLHSLRGG